MRPARIETPPKGCALEGIQLIFMAIIIGAFICIVLNLWKEIL